MPILPKNTASGSTTPSSRDNPRPKRRTNKIAQVVSGPTLRADGRVEFEIDIYEKGGDGTVLARRPMLGAKKLLSPKAKNAAALALKKLIELEIDAYEEETDLWFKGFVHEH